MCIPSHSACFRGLLHGLSLGIYHVGDRILYPSSTHGSLIDVTIHVIYSLAIFSFSLSSVISRAYSDDQWSAYSVPMLLTFKLFYKKNRLSWLLLSGVFYVAPIKSIWLPAGRPGFHIWWGQEMFLYSTASYPSLCPPRLLSNRYRGLFPWSKTAGAWSWTLTV